MGDHSCNLHSRYDLCAVLYSKDTEPSCGDEQKMKVMTEYLRIMAENKGTVTNENTTGHYTIPD